MCVSRFSNWSMAYASIAKNKVSPFMLILSIVRIGYNIYLKVSLFIKSMIFNG